MHLKTDLALARRYNSWTPAVDYGKDSDVLDTWYGKPYNHRHLHCTAVAFAQGFVYYYGADISPLFSCH